MQAKEANFLQFLDGSKQFMIPIYQRTYSWTLTQCQQFWNDIRRVADNPTGPGHFIGSIVYIQEGLFQATSVPELLVIDGQQRLTTLTLLLAALHKVVTENNTPGINTKKIQSYIYNLVEEGDARYKLVLTQTDKDTLRSILDDTPRPEKVSKRLAENYDYFLKQLRDSKMMLGELYQGISKLIIVYVALDAHHDNPQLIFESMNSTGLDLSQADLIRNYVLMGQKNNDQQHLYKAYWYPMEQSFGQADYAIQFDRFIRDYLTVKTGNIPNIRDVYTAFKGYAYSQIAPSFTITQLIADIARFSTYFTRMAFLKEPDNQLREAFFELNTLRVEVAFPFLLELYADYDTDHLSKADMLAILRLIESYVFRRAMCDIATNSLNKTFLTLYKDVRAIQEATNCSMLDGFITAFHMKDSYTRFPSNEEFKDAFPAKDVYHSPRRNYMLRKLENFERKELVNVEAYTIEHIMPQNPDLSPQWQKELGDNWKEIQERYLHTIGNLTLTGYNQEMSDKPFAAKRDGEAGFKSSPLYLNQSIRQQERWGEQAISQRGIELAERATKVWPSLPDRSTIATAYQSAKAAKKNRDPRVEDHYKNMSLDTQAVFAQLRKRILNLDALVREEPKKNYIAYKTTTNFVDIEPQKNMLRLTLNLAIDQLDDPKGLCKDVSGVGKYGNGDVEVRISTAQQIDDVMDLVRQAFEQHGPYTMVMSGMS